MGLGKRGDNFNENYVKQKIEKVLADRICKKLRIYETDFKDRFFFQKRRTSLT
jgi:hypothetical protein